MPEALVPYSAEVVRLAGPTRRSTGSFIYTLRFLSSTYRFYGQSPLSSSDHEARNGSDERMGGDSWDSVEIGTVRAVKTER
jgi:hypothetical protein